MRDFFEGRGRTSRPASPDSASGGSPAATQGTRRHGGGQGLMPKLNNRRPQVEICGESRQRREINIHLGFVFDLRQGHLAPLADRRLLLIGTDSYVMHPTASAFFSRCRIHLNTHTFNITIF